MLKVLFQNSLIILPLVLNFGKFIELTNGQVNLLSTYTEWSIMETELKNIILDMYQK